jgi:hypothetical protein
VSSWKSGKNKATEQQLGELLRRYGARLNRTTARVYLVYEEPSVPWQETELGRQLVELEHRRQRLAAEIQEKRAAEQQRAQSESARAKREENAGLMAGPPPVSEQPPGRAWQPSPDAEAAQEIAGAVKELRAKIDPFGQREHSLANLIALYQESHLDKGDQRIVQVEGRILFRYTFVQPILKVRHKISEVGREPIARWIIHDLQHGKMLVVRQMRRRLVAFDLQRWESTCSRVLSDRYGSSGVPSWIDSADDAGRWLSVLEGPMSVEGVLQLVDKYLGDHEMPHSPHDEQVLPYLIRKALVEHGHPVPGIDRITAFE